MFTMTFIIGWGWLLGVGLLAPISLPAGGAILHNPQVRRSGSSRLLLTNEDVAFRSSPLNKAPTLCALPLGTPLRVLRAWQNDIGETWLQVKVTSSTLLDLVPSAKRGWVKI